MGSKLCRRAGSVSFGRHDRGGSKSGAGPAPFPVVGLCCRIIFGLPAYYHLSSRLWAFVVIIMERVQFQQEQVCRMHPQSESFMCDADPFSRCSLSSRI